MFSELYVSGLRLSREIPAGNYLRKLPVCRHLRQMDSLTFSRPVTFFVGENGVGKSTLIEALAISMGFNPEGGTINFHFSTADSHSDLYQYLTVAKGIRRPRDGFFLRAESFYNVASQIDELDKASPAPLLPSYGGVSLHQQSHGESFLALVEHRFGGNGLYILDEPEAALSPMRQLELLCYINRLVKDRSQFFISTHSPILMALPGAEVLELSAQGIRSVPYQETAHFQTAKNFLSQPERMLKILLED